MGLVPDVKQSMLNSHFLYILLMISVMHYWLFHLEYYYFDNQSGQFQFCNAYKISTDTSFAILDNFFFLVCISFVILDNYLPLWPVPVLQYLIIFCLSSPDLVLQEYIIFSFIRPDSLLYIYHTLAWPGFAKLHYFVIHQA